MFFQPTKWAVEAIGESLAQEAAEFGVHVTLIEPGAHATTFLTGPSARTAIAIPAYDGARARQADSRAGRGVVPASVSVRPVFTDRKTVLTALWKSALPSRWACRRWG
jgi:NAD(P)-dependent dehydrogenase (short-subunit alcohol dehydrogenase family)